MKALFSWGQCGPCVVCRKERIRGGMGGFFKGGILCCKREKEWGTFLKNCVVLLWSGQSWDWCVICNIKNG
jgi:hypothetical protein